jgi:hypothetical protein
MAGDYQEGVHREGVPQLVGNVAMHEMQYPQHIDAPNYDAAHYRPPPPPVSYSYHLYDMFPF